MMGNVKRIVFILLLTVMNSMQAQPPGYMGKRFTVGYSASFFPSLLGPQANGYNAGMNLTHSFDLDYTIRNRTNLCFSYQLLRTGADIRNYD